MFFYHFHFTKIHTGTYANWHPQCRTNKTESNKSRIRHFADTCYKWREGTHDGNETRHDDSARTIFIIELLGFFQMRFAEEKRIFPAEYFWPNETPHPVIHVITTECCQHNNAAAKQWVQLSCGCCNRTNSK